MTHNINEDPDMRAGMKAYLDIVLTGGHLSQKSKERQLRKYDDIRVERYEVEYVVHFGTWDRDAQPNRFVPDKTVCSTEEEACELALARAMGLSANLIDMDKEGLTTEQVADIYDMIESIWVERVSKAKRTVGFIPKESDVEYEVAPYDGTLFHRRAVRSGHQDFTPLMPV